MRESRLVAQILQYLRLRGYACGKVKTMGVVRNGRYTYDPNTFRGFPDICAFVPGIVFIECKSEKGRQSPAQKDFQELCEKSNTPYILAQRLEDVIAYLDDKKR